MNLPQALALAMQHHQAGRLAEAEGLYRQILVVNPRHGDALHLLGVIAHQVGRSDAAIDLIRQALQSLPGFAEAHNRLGMALFSQGRIEEAVASYHRAIKLDPNHAKALNNLGAALRRLGGLDEAVAASREAIRIDPNFADAHNNLGVAFLEQRRLDESAAACREAIRLNPNDPVPHYNLGNTLNEQKQFDGAISAYQHALRLNPDYTRARMNLGNVMEKHGQLDGALECFRRVAELHPEFAGAHNNLANILWNQGRTEEAIADYERAVQLEPASSAMHSSLLAALHYSPATTPARLLAAHAEYDRRHCAPLRSTWREHRNLPDPDRRLKVGYLSPDFRRNVVSHFLLPVLEAHDHRQFEIHCYATAQRTDAITDRFRASADVWRDAGALSDEALAEQIREDEIDILVDLSQHMPGNRLPVFARKPAPVQVAWIGHPWSTGVTAIDYRLTDAHMEPEGAAWSESVEEPVRLPDSWFCFDPLDETPDPGELPALRAGYVTFGCLNNFSRVNEDVLALWARVLHAVKDSRLLLRCPAGATQARALRSLESQGIESGRVELVGWTPSRAELERRFERMDIALDPFPCNGGTTTCDTLWMGVPVLTLPGEVVVARIGLSILSAAGLADFVAHSEDDFVRLAARLAKDVPHLAQVRRTMRERMRSSAFMDAHGFTRNVERAYREMWRKWSAG